jgi:GNAT superfamily N-acetyltransferase
MDSESAAPPHWESDVVLADGGTVHVRPIRPADAEALVDFHAGLSDETVYLRFFGPKPELDPVTADRFTNVDHVDRVALVAELGGRLVGVARYDRVLDTDSAEVAFVVSDEHQGRGIGTSLLEHLASAARERGVTRFVATTSRGIARCSASFRARASTRPRAPMRTSSTSS